MDSPCSCCFS